MEVNHFYLDIQVMQTFPSLKVDFLDYDLTVSVILGDEL